MFLNAPTSTAARKPRNASASDAPAAATDVDRETTTGYEKTTRYSGHKAMEKYDRSSKHGEISVMVADRFVVAAEGNGVDMDALKNAVGQVNLGRLESMKNQGVK